MGNSAELLLFSPSMKMADLMNVRPSLPGVLTRMGIPFGFGDETVEEVFSILKAEFEEDEE